MLCILIGCMIGTRLILIALDGFGMFRILTV